MKSIKFFIVVSISLCLAHGVIGRLRNRIQDKFFENGIVPDILDCPPKSQLEVTFGTNSVQPGEILTPEETSNTVNPQFTWETKPNNKYLLIGLDPDVINRTVHEYRAVIHLLRYNIPARNIQRGVNIIPYFGPKPPENSGLHRYVFLVFRQKKKIDVTPEDLPKTLWEGGEYVFNFDLVDFAERKELVEVVAGNFFLCQNQLQKQ